VAEANFPGFGKLLRFARNANVGDNAMSAIGGGGLNLGPLATTPAGIAGQQRVAGADRQQAEAAERKFQLDRQAATEKTVGDIGASDETQDRDADGRQPWVISRRKGDAKNNASSPQPTSPDPDHERGGQLDLQA
jgi:hypothetical protein